MKNFNSRIGLNFNSEKMKFLQAPVILRITGDENERLAVMNGYQHKVSIYC